MTQPSRHTDDYGGSRRSAVLLVAAFSLFSPLSLLAVNIPRGASPWKSLLVALAGFLVGIAAVAGLARRLDVKRAAGMVCACLFCFFSWSVLEHLGGRLSSSPMVEQVLVPLTILAILLWAAVRFGRTQAFSYVLAAVAIALVVSPLPALVGWYAGEPTHLGTPTAPISSPAGTRPDVYVLVLDGYGRADVLEDIYGFSNRPFLDELARRRFEIPEAATANYSMTAASLASALTMEYVVDPGMVPDHRLRLALYEAIRGQNPIVATLQGLGYEYVHIESGWDGSRCGPAVDECYRAGFLDEATWTLLARTPLEGLLQSQYGHAFALNGLRAFDDLAAVAAASSKEPRLVLAHILLPHPPLVVDRQCRARPEPEPGGGAVGARFLVDTPAWEDRKAAYVQQVECVNLKILRFLDQLGDESVVFITGDHGPDAFGQLSVAPPDWTEADWVERFGVMSAYRMADGCPDVRPDLDVLNGMRLVVECVTGTPLASLPQRNLVFPTPDGDPHPVLEVNVEEGDV